jgi:hypothetical protein
VIELERELEELRKDVEILKAQRQAAPKAKSA